MRDDDFLETILDDPSDRDALLVYADWLEEHGGEEAKIEYLRLSARCGDSGDGEQQGGVRLRYLAAQLDTDWLAVVSRLDVERCAAKVKQAMSEPSQRMLNWNFVCDRKWEDLLPSGDPRIRFCQSCHHCVFYCSTTEEVRAHSRAGHCVAVDQRATRTNQPQQLVLGCISDAVRTPLPTDPVSKRRRRNRTIKQASNRQKSGRRR